MHTAKSKVLGLKLKEVFDPEFVREVLDRKKVGDSSPLAVLLRSNTSKTLVRRKVLTTFTKSKGSVPKLSDLVSYTPSEMRSMAKLGAKGQRWLEEYLHLLGVVLPHTKSVHGMSSAARKFLSSL